MNAAVHLLVSGVVQGVGFRYFARKNAIQAGICGYARNLFSGEVEIEAVGSRQLLEAFIDQIKQGPRSSVVTNVEIEWLTHTPEYESFEIG